MFVVLAVVLLMPLVHDGSRVVLFGLDVRVWLVALGLYAPGVLAGAAAVRSRTKWANRCVTLPPCVAPNRVGISLLPGQRPSPEGRPPFSPGSA